MNFTNINDPAGVSALLEQLRASQAWSDLQIQTSSDRQTPPMPQQESSGQSSINSDSSPSVASLLSQLSSSATSSNAHAPYELASSSRTIVLSDNGPSANSICSAQPVPRKKQDVKGFSFQQSLSRLAHISEDPIFLEAIAKLRRDQEELEKQLWEEREVMHAKQAEKVNIAVTKANMLGTGISDREATTMRQNFEKELHLFDRERVLPAWDGLIACQQAALESLGVPAMFVTSTGADRERQQRVMHVLEGIVDAESPSVV
ncbi:hypothetical protein M0805_005433 [Coniferiporia weirii]|nr:hypothetical protein M0805_005433 [Coniferiporia weirii]